MSLAEIFEYHGAERYRELCVDSLREILAQPDGCILEVGGSVVLDPTAWDLLSHGSEVVWLYASPVAYLQRVVDQGDLRSMEGRHGALGELRAILAEREPLYARATHHLDTVDIGQVGATGAVVGLFSG
jgi:XRE family aerobic/anaerobic benzoate catabolism transcriptional regulator